MPLSADRLPPQAIAAASASELPSELPPQMEHESTHSRFYRLYRRMKNLTRKHNTSYHHQRPQRLPASLAQLSFATVLQQEELDVERVQRCLQALHRITKIVVVRVTGHTQRPIRRPWRRHNPNDGGGEDILTVTMQIHTHPQHALAPLVGSQSISIYQPGTRLQCHEITRPFEEFVRLRKLLYHCVKKEKHVRHLMDDLPSADAPRAKTACTFCLYIKSYMRLCWERPALVIPSNLSTGCALRKSVLGHSMQRFVELATMPSSSCGNDVNNELVPSTDRNSNNNIVGICRHQADVAVIMQDFLECRNLTTAMKPMSSYYLHLRPLAE